MTSVDLYPAIDLRDGRCVRLHQGDYDRETVYGEDPAGQAAGFATDGAPWIHVVDLDAARSGVAANTSAIASIVDRVDVPVQVGGGVRSVDAAVRLFDLGVDRVVMGTAAVESPALVEQVAARGPVSVGLDVRGREVATHGWEQGSGRDVLEMVSTLDDAGAAACVVTQIAVDGTMDGPDLDLLTLVGSATDVAVIASGGIGDAGHLRSVAALAPAVRPAGVIVGRALYEGALTVTTALDALRATATRGDGAS